MPIVIESGQLARAMKSAATVVERGTQPILANVRLRTVDGMVEIATTNLDVEFRQLVSLAVPGEIDTTIEAQKLLAIANAAEGAQVKLTQEDGRVIAQAGRSRWVLPSLESQWFTELPFDGQSAPVNIGGAALARIFSRVGWSICTEETLWWLCGVYVDPEPTANGAVMRFTTATKATFASVISDVPWPEGAAPITIASKCVRLMEGLVADHDEVAIAWDKSKIRITAGDAQLTGKLIDGPFPAYRNAYNFATEEPVLVDPEALRKAIKRIEIVGLDKSRSIAVDVQEGALEVRPAGNGAGEASEHVPASCQPRHRSGFDGRLLSEALRCVGGDTVEIHQASPTTSALLRRAVDDGVMCGLGPMSL
ncbi:hypothetical protein [Novosphingobium sp. fls2-241-R2A-195]|uniref:DNA polymerase III subunit beta n=1 Tax=Novosphingobium sp. fls2-241-R2A-195 TaxID=3040296 RepID=UPI00254AD41D|nr:hypothetical protein [Novosphingobium sp. fls2-241-R2A-195]